MRELRLIAPPPRNDLLDRLAGRLGDVLPGGRIVARDLLGIGGRIDFAVVEPHGRLTLVLVGGEDEDLELVGRALAQRAFVAPRLPDWLKLAPQLGLRPEAGVRGLLLCHRVRPETRAAVRSLGPEVLEVAGYRCVHGGAGLEVLLELDLHEATEDGDAEGRPRELPTREAASARPRREPAGPAHAAPAGRPHAAVAPDFRTGLSDADLGGLSEGELREFE